MSDLLTTRQVQTLLQVDRTTIYRMLRDGRLTGIKVGHQWRFSSQHISELLNDTPLPQHEDSSAAPQTNLPIDCFQLMQDIFSDITEIGTLTIKPDGTPLTKASTNCQFCQMILDSKTGHQACQASWYNLTEHLENQGDLALCHAGLQYMLTPIKLGSSVEAVLIAGQFYNQPPDPAEESGRVQKLAQKHGLDETELAHAARDILVLSGRNKANFGDWLNKIAAAFEHISCERASFMDRLQKIAAMSDVTQN